MLNCSCQLIYVVVERRRPLCWACGVADKMSKACPGIKPETQVNPATTNAKVESVTRAKHADGPEEWTAVIKKGAKAAITPPPIRTTQSGPRNRLQNHSRRMSSSRKATFNWNSSVSRGRRSNKIWRWKRGTYPGSP